jgi:AraC family transcriptional regulator
MNEVMIRIVKLEPLRVAYYRAISKSPEEDAMKVLRAWGEPKGMYVNPNEHYHFGYNNPPPSNLVNSKGEYGCECLITVSSEVEPEGKVKIKKIPGGLYAVARCQGPQNITQTWIYLHNNWLKKSKYDLDDGNLPGLEELITPLEPSIQKWIFDLYIPIKERE